MVRSRIGRVAKSNLLSGTWYLLRLENKVVKWSVYLKKYISDFYFYIIYLVYALFYLLSTCCVNVVYRSVV